MLVFVGMKNINKASFLVPPQVAKSLVQNQSTEFGRSPLPYDRFVLDNSDALGKKCLIAAGLLVDSTGEKRDANAILVVSEPDLATKALHLAA